MSFLDAYERKARLTPGLLAFAPIAFAIAALGLKKFPAVAVAAGILSAAGGGYALSILVGNLGRHAQQSLWESWGGAPTTRMLRTRDPAVNTVQREIWRQAVEAYTGVSLLSAENETRDPNRADEAIMAAVGQIKLLGQDSRFPLVKTENTHYGYERNIYGFRWVGRLISISSIIAMTLVMLLTNFAREDFSKGGLLGGIVVDTAIFAAWVFLPSAHRAKAPGKVTPINYFKLSQALGASPDRLTTINSTTSIPENKIRGASCR